MTTIQAAPPTRRQAKSAPRRLKTIAIWGTPGSGKSTIALNLAVTLAKRAKVLLIDADTQQPSQTAALALTDHPAGLAPLLRFARLSRLGPEEFAKQSMLLKSKNVTFTLVPGATPNRWPEITPAAFEQLIEYCQREFDFIVIDAASSLEPGLYSQDSPLERNAFTRWLIQSSQLVIETLNPEPVSVARFLAAQEDLKTLRPNQPTLTVVNKMRLGALGPNAKNQLSHSLKMLANTKIHAFLPFDPRSTDAALRNGSPLNSIRRKSPLLKAIVQLVQEKKLSG